MEPSRTMFRKFSRRTFVAGLAATAALPIVAACQPQVVEKIVEKPVEVVITQVVERIVEKEVIVQEVVEVEKEVIVEVEREVIVEVEKEKIVVATPIPISSMIKFQSRGGEPDLKAAKALVAAYNEVFPQKVVEIDHTTGDHFQKVQLDIAAGLAPDVYFDASLRTGGIGWNKGIIESLEPYLRADFNQDEHIEQIWLAMTYGGNRISVPFDGGAEALFFNVDLFEAAGVPVPDHTKRMTWDEVLELGIRLTEDMDGKHPNEAGFDPTRIKTYGFQASTYFLTGGDQHVHTAGGEVMDPDGNMVIDSPVAIEAYQKTADWGIKHFVSPTIAYAQAGAMSFYAGNIAMRQANVFWTVILRDSGQFQFGVAPTPMLKVPATTGYYSGQAMTKVSKDKDAAWHWMNWTGLSFEGQSVVSSSGLLQPTHKRIIEKWFNNPSPNPGRASLEVFYEELSSETVRWAGDRLQEPSLYRGWGQFLVDTWSPRFDPVARGKTEYSEIAREMRGLLQEVLETGEPLRE